MPTTQAAPLSPAVPASDRQASPGGWRLHGFAAGFLMLAVAVIAVLTLIALANAAARAPAGTLLLALFPPGMSREGSLLAVHGSGALPVRSLLFGRGMIVALTGAGDVAALKRAGAVAVLADLAIGPQLGGCAVMSEPVRAPAQVLRP